MRNIYVVIAAGMVLSVVSARIQDVRANTAFNLPTSVSLSVCGDGLVSVNETCDTVTNSGAYSQNLAGRNCMPDCHGWGPYCGDLILQSSQTEECDDGNGVTGDGCSDICKVQEVFGGCCPGLGPVPVGGGGAYVPGSDAPPQATKVAVYGKAYPEASVHILKDGVAIGVVKADTKADFYFATTDISPGIATFGFWAEDAKNLRSVAYTLTFRVIPNAVTTVTGAYLPPTITLDKKKVDKGEPITFSGQSAPVVDVHTYVNSEEEFIAMTKSDESGNWVQPFDTMPLAEDFHTARALFQTGTSTEIIQSSFSELVSFYVGEGGAVDMRKRSDINGDGRVNFVDFSILIFYWGSSYQNADINVDGRINIIDFSILLTNWTG